MGEYTLPIETYYSNNNPLNVLSNFYFKFMQAHPNETFNYYMLGYRNSKRTTQQVTFDFCENKSDTISSFNSYQCTGAQYRCQFYVVYNENENYYTAENFDYTTAVNECREMTGLSIYDTYANATNTYWASNMWEQNYLNTTKWTTQEVEPSPSPSPEEPSGEGTQFSDINPYFWLIPSFVLMLIFMYKFLDKIFSRGD